MKILVICPKNSGNTYRVCQYVCSNSEAKLFVLNGAGGPDFSGCDSIVLASGIYAGHVHKNILELVKNLRTDTLKPGVKFYMFMTWFGRGGSDQTAFTEIQQILAGKGIDIEKQYITCFGKGLGVVRMSHPNKEDCKNVLSWVKEHIAESPASTV